MTAVACTVWQRLTLLLHLHEGTRSLNEAWARLARVQTTPSSAADREPCAPLRQVTRAVTDQRRAGPNVQAPPGSERLAPQHKATRTRLWRL